VVMAFYVNLTNIVMFNILIDDLFPLLLDTMLVLDFLRAN